MEINFFKKITDTENGDKLSIDGFLQQVKHGTWKDRVEAIRSGDLDQKKSLPYVTISGIFNSRRNDGLIKHSGFICLDIDKIGEDVDVLFNQIIKDEYVYGAFKSASGNGIAVIVKIDGKKHSEAYFGLEKYFCDKFEVMLDKQCKDVARPRFVSYDPMTYINQNAEIFKIYLKKETAETKKAQFIITGKNDIDFIIEQIYRRSIDLTHNSYHRFLEIGFAIASEYGESGRAYFHQIVCNSPKYKESAANKQYDNCLRANGNGISIATLYHFCKEEGIAIVTEDTKRAITVSSIMKKSGRGLGETIKVLTDVEGFNSDHANEIGKKVYDSEVISKDNELGKIEQIEVFLQTNYNLKRNEVTRFIENDTIEIDTTFSNSVYIKLRKNVNDGIKFEEVDKLIHSEFTPDFNPLKEFFENREHLKQSGIIDSFIQCIDSPTGLEHGNTFPKYKEIFFKKWLVGLIASIYGKHSPLCLVLSGGQNTGKTEFFRRLLPKELDSYYAESKLDAGKDDEILMCQKILILDDEFGGKSKMESKRFKELTSKQFFTLREPYGRKNVRLKRLAVLAGTSNETEILNDPTGNRRILPIEVTSINFDLYNQTDKTLLLLEAYHLFKEGFDWNLTSDEIKELNKNSSGFEQVRMEKELIVSYFKKGEDAVGFEVTQYMQTSDIKAYIESSTMQKVNIYKLSQELKALGFTQLRKKLNGVASRVWAVIKTERSDVQEVQESGKNDFEMPF